MRFIKRLLGFLLVLLVLLVAIAFVLPGHAHVERSIVIARPASQIHALLVNFQRFNEWSPWAAKDPNAKYTYSGPPAGVGAKLAWVGNPDTVGSGSQTISASVPNQSVSIALDFGDMGQSAAKFTLTPEAPGTRVRWTLDSDLPMNLDRSIVWNVMGRYFGLFMDKMVGPDFEAGLAKLKVLSETFPNVDIAGIEPLIESDVAARKILFVSSSATNDAETVKAALSTAYAAISVVMQSAFIQFAGAPMTLTTSYDGKTWSFDAAVPVDRNDVPVDGAVKPGLTPAGRMVRLDHVGAYDGLATTAEKAYAWIAVQGMKPRDRMIEEYVNDPETTAPEQIRTIIRIPVH